MFLVKKFHNGCIYYITIIHSLQPKRKLNETKMPILKPLHLPKRRNTAQIIRTIRTNSKNRFFNIFRLHI